MVLLRRVALTCPGCSATVMSEVRADTCTVANWGIFLLTGWWCVFIPGCKDSPDGSNWRSIPNVTDTCSRHRGRSLGCSLPFLFCFFRPPPCLVVFAPSSCLCISPQGAPSPTGVRLLSLFGRLCCSPTPPATPSPLRSHHHPPTPLAAVVAVGWRPSDSGTLSKTQEGATAYFEGGARAPAMLSPVGRDVGACGGGPLVRQSFVSGSAGGVISRQPLRVGAFRGTGGAVI